MWTKSHAYMGRPCPEAQTSRVNEPCQHLQKPSMHKGTNATPTPLLCKLSRLLDSLSENSESLYALMHPNLPAFHLLEHTLTCHICKSWLGWGHPGLTGVSSVFRNAHFPRDWWEFAPEPFPSCFSLGAPFKVATHTAQQLFRNKDLTPRWGILGDELGTILNRVSSLKPAWLTYYELVSLPVWLANQLTLHSVPRGLSALSNWASNMTCKLLSKSTLGGVAWVAVTEDAYSRKFSSQQVWNSCAPTYCLWPWEGS